MPDDLTPRQVADELGVTVRTVQRWIADGRLPSTRIGSRVRVSRSSLSAVAEGAPAASSVGPIRTLLIANRGEIAARVARTAHRLGMRVDRHPRAGRPPAGWNGRGPRDPGLPGRRGDPRGRGARRGRWGPSGLRVPRREPGVCPPGDRGRPALGRAAGRGDRRDGRQGRGSPARGRPRRPDGSRLRRRGAGRRDAGRRGGAHRLSVARQAQRRAAAGRACASSASPAS